MWSGGVVQFPFIDHVEEIKPRTRTRTRTRTGLWFVFRLMRAKQHGSATKTLTPPRSGLLGLEASCPVPSPGVPLG